MKSAPADSAAPPQPGRGRAALLLRPDVVAALLAVLPLLIPLTLHASYHTHDDMQIVVMASGGVPGISDPSYPTTAYVYNLLLAALYRMVPSISWHGWLVYLGLVLGWFLTLRALVAQIRDWITALMLALTLIPAIVTIFSFPTYTTCALVCVFGTSLSWLEWSYRPPRTDRPPARLIALTAITVGCALLMRWQLALVGIGLFPWLLFAKRQWRSLALLIAGVLLFVGVDRCLLWLTASPGTRSYVSWNNTRARFLDTPAGYWIPSVTPRALAAAGWTWQDRNAFHGWILFDQQKFTPTAVSRFLSRNRSPDLGRFVRGRLENLEWNVLTHLEWFTLAAFSLVVIVLSRGASFNAWSWQSWLRGGSWLGPIALALLYVVSFRFVRRVWLPFFMLIPSAIYLLSRVRANGATVTAPAPLGVARLTFLLSIALFSGCLAHFIIGNNRTAMRVSESSDRRSDQLFAKLKRKYPEVRLLIKTNICTEHVQNLHVLRDRGGVRGPQFFPYDLLLGTPHFYHVLRSLGRSSGVDLLRWSIDNPTVAYVVSAEWAGGLWLQYLNYLARRRVVFRRLALDEPGRPTPLFVVLRLVTEK